MEKLGQTPLTDSVFPTITLSSKEQLMVFDYK